MGAKKAHHPAPGGVGKKPRLEGAGDIKRFFDTRPAHPGEQDDAAAASRVTPPPHAAPPPALLPLAAAAAPAQELRADGAARAAAGPHPAVLYKHLAALQDIGPADSYAMSQDTDAMQMQVVWNDSPGATSQPLARSLSNLGRSTSGGASELNAIKQRLISAAQKPRDVRRPGPGALAAGAAGGAAGRLQQSEQFLEGLLARHHPAVAAPVAAAAQQQESGQSGGRPDPAAAAAGAAGGGAHRTPGTHLRGILKRRGSGKQTPASSVKFSLADSTSKGGRGRGVTSTTGGGHAGSSGKKRHAAGQKRRALLDLLDQVESIVHSGGSPQEGADAEEAAAAVVDEEVDVGVASDKENTAGSMKTAVGGSQERAAAAGAGGAAPAAMGPTGSQQLMPPPGGLRCCGTQRPAAAQTAQPAAAAALQAAPAAAAAGPPPGHGGGFAGADEDDEEDDALMAQLELQLLTQVEQRQAAARHGAPLAAGRPPVPPARQQQQQQQQRGPPRAGAAVQAVPGHSQAAPGRPQAAPPAVQHPAAAAAAQQAQQQQQQQQAGRTKGLPRSPYDKRPQGPVPPAAAPAGAAAAAAGPPPPGATGAPMQTGSDDSWDDDFDTDLLDQFEAAALQQRAEGASGRGASGGQGAAKQPEVAEGAGRPPPAAPAVPSCYPGGREDVHYEIKEIFQQETELILKLHNKYQKRNVYAHLHAPWADLSYRVGDTVNILVPQLDWFDGAHHCLLNMERGMLILHPDLLLSGTRITTSHECPRRSFLDERVAGSGSNDKAVKGTLQHNLIQAALTEGLRTPPQLYACAERVMGEATEALLEVDLSEEAALQCLREAVPGIIRWMHRFLRAAPASDSLLGAGMDYSTGKDIRRMVAVQEVVDIEESIWSTKFGVKGMIDISATLALDDLAARPYGPLSGWMQQAAAAGGAAPLPPGREVTVGPVEIKTGKMHDSHKAQVLLYLLLMEERYGKPLDWGMLWYTTQTDPQLVVKRPMDLACLMAVRNRLAAAIAHREMPELSEEKRQCNWCFQQLNCALAYKAERGEGGTADSFVRPSTDRGGNLDRIQQELAGKYERAAGHMTPADCEFLKKWENLVTLEEGNSVARRPEIWAMAGAERQQLGRCVAGVVLSHVDEEQLLYTFCRPTGAAMDCGFQEGEMLLLSVEGQHVAVARGYFYTCTATHVTISLNRAMRRGLLKPGGGGAPADASAAAGGSGVLFDASIKWRLDRDDVSSTFVRLRGNLFALFRREFETRQDPATRKLSYGGELPESQHAAKLRRLIVDLAAPRYAARDPTQPDPTPPGMNSEQYEAVQRVLASQDYTLVLGMPGAGKTTTIVSMVQALVRQGKSVLLTSYTNSAVDNILMKLAREEVPFVRLGRPSGVHPAVRPWVPGGERYPQKTTRELARLAESVPVFGATCFGVHHAMLKDKTFDVCIIDEAGQMVLPASLGPLLTARSFVLVGDHNQLPPLVTNKDAEAGGLGESLFKRLSDAHPQVVVTLPVQYRMAADIMLLPNALIYNNALRCGTDGIAQAALELAPAAAAVVAALPGWLQAVLDPQRRVLFLDTSHVEGARETVAGDAMSNRGEAQLVVRLLQAATAAGLPGDQIGVISPYRAQVALLGRLAKEAGGLDEVEVLTVDKCQGRDKDCILLSLVRSNPEAEAGKLLADWRRINVAITRSRKKLVLLGDAATLRTIQLFARLVALVQERGWYLQLPADALLQQQQQP